MTEPKTVDQPERGLSLARPGASFAARRAPSFRGQSLFAVLQHLRDACGFDLLVDVTCVDYLNYRDAEGPLRPGVPAGQHRDQRADHRADVSSTIRSRPCRRSCRCGKGPTGWSARCGTCSASASTGHPDLRRILLPEEFTAHPLRKDYPLQGRGERHNFPVLHARAEALTRLDDLTTVSRAPRSRPCR